MVSIPQSIGQFFRLVLPLYLLGLTSSLAFAQTFRVNPTQVDVILSPGFNHLPMTVNVLSNSPGLDISAIQVTSDAAWVQPSVDASAGKIVLTFATSNLISLSHTATLTARQGTNTQVFFVNGTLIPLNVFKLVDDPVRSRVYGIHINGLERGNVLVLDPLSGSPIGSITVGKKPTDLAVSRDGSELFVLNTVDKTINVVDLNSLRITETINVPYDNWGASDTTGDIAVGPGRLLYYSDGAWAPQIRVFNRSTGAVLQTVGMLESGFGDFALTSDFKTLVGWAQYGWHAGIASSFAARFTVDNQGLLTLAERTENNYPTGIVRDPLDAPVLFSSDDEKVFVKVFAFNSGALSAKLHSFPSPIYSISPGGEVAATSTAIFETESGNKVYTLPVSAPVQVITSDYARLVYFDPQNRSIQSINLLTEIGPAILKRTVSPANGAIVLPPDRLTWQPLAGADRYRVYLGTSQDLINSAETNSTSFLGSVSATEFFVQSTLAPGTTYFWRVDPVTSAEVIRGEIYSFTVSSMSSSTNEINVTTIQGHRNFRTTVELQSRSPGQRWRASANMPWISFAQTNGTTPTTLEVVLDASQLAVGFHSATITLSDGTNSLFTLPVKLRVEGLKLTLLESDPLSEVVYGITEDASNPAARAYLLEVNTRTEGIERLIPVGNSVTDLAVHNGDGRIYVPNWMGGSLLAVNKTNFVVERTYAFQPFGGTGYGEGDVYKVAAGAPGRLIVEEQDQWIDISVFDTLRGTNIARAFEREGGGASSGNGRYYYHGDNNSSGAQIHKFDLIGDAFNKQASIRVESAGYYGSRVVVVSEDGQRVFWNGSVFNANLVEEWTIRDLIYSATPDGRFAFGQDKIYDIALRRVALGMPATTTVSAFNSTTRKLVAQVNGSIRFFTLEDPVSLPKPVLSLVAATETTATLGWIDNSLETGFTLQQRLAGDALWVNVATLPQNTNSTTVTELIREATYEFRVKADATGISSDWSEILTVTTPGLPPETPALTLASLTSAGVILEWSFSSPQVQLSLQRRIAGGANSPWNVIFVPNGTTNRYDDSAVTIGTTYEYRLGAANSWGTNYSTVLNATVPEPSPPAAPLELDARIASATTIQLNWSPSTEATGYILERRTDSPNSWAVVANFPATTQTYLDTSLLPGTEYWYRVAATNSIGISPYSPVDNVVLLLSNFACIVSDSFDPGLDPTAWAELLGGRVVNGGTGFLTGNSLWFGTNTTRLAATIPLPLSPGTTIEFKLRAGNEARDGDTFWNNSEPGEGIVLEYSLDGFTWLLLRSYDTANPTLSGWSTNIVQLPVNAASVRTQLRWRQVKHSGAGFDSWAIDDVCIRGNQSASLTAPPFIMATPGSSTRVALFWFGSPGASHYIIERQKSGGAWEQIGITSSQQTYFTDANAMPQTTYAYRLKAATTISQSSYSPVAFATTFSQSADWLNQNLGNTNTPLSSLGSDGVPNVIRYAFNLDLAAPITEMTVGGESGIPRIWYDSGRKQLAAEFVRRKPQTDPGISYEFQVSENLAEWTVIDSPAISENINPIWERVRYDSPAPIGVGQRVQFVRVIVRILP